MKKCFKNKLKIKYLNFRCYNDLYDSYTEPVNVIISERGAGHIHYLEEQNAILKKALNTLAKKFVISIMTETIKTKEQLEEVAQKQMNFEIEQAKELLK